jgi:integrase
MRFPLKTADKDRAAEGARDRYIHLVAHGWPATVAKFKPTAVKKLKVATIGSWLEADKATAGFRGSTFTNYANSIRQIASQIEDIGDQPAPQKDGEKLRNPQTLSRRNIQSGGHRLWLEKVDALPLTVLSATNVQRWKLVHIEKAGPSPDARRRAENTAASRLRSARALFSPRARQFAATELILPEPLPFAGVKIPRKGNTAYQSKIDATALINAAKKELVGEPFKIFTLGLLCGLRKGEIDTLAWTQIDFGKSVIRIECTEHFAPKPEDSAGEIDLDPELVSLLKTWRARAKGPFVVESKRKPAAGG